MSERRFRDFLALFVPDYVNCLTTSAVVGALLGQAVRIKGWLEIVQRKATVQ